jgi:TetR/AcrR family transcriptional regulator, regulator of autoinduction and epiphytic fitness
MSEAAVLPRGDAVAKVNGMVRTDGRNRRAAETRRKIIEAAKAMIEETSEAPTVVGVARRADVSVRSVFQHFKDVQSLFVTIVDNVRDTLDVPPATSQDLPLDSRIAGVVGNLATVFDQIVPLHVAAGQFVHHPALNERRVWLRQNLREATLQAFAPELAGLEEVAREKLADAICAALSLDAWILLRRAEKRSFDQAVGVWRLTLKALLEHGLGLPKAQTCTGNAD